MLKNKFLSSKKQKPIIEEEKPSKKSKILKKILFAILFVITLLSILRIPYFGQVIDAICFSFLFGYAKYLLYAYLLFFLTLKIFGVKKKPLYSKRIFLFIFFCTCFISMLIGGIQIIINKQIQNEVQYYINDIWKAKVWNLKNHWFFGDGDYFDGGLIGSILSSISGVFIICLALLLIVVFYFIFFSNQRKKIIKKILQKTSTFKESHINYDQNGNLIEKKLISEQKQNSFDVEDNYKQFDINITDIKKSCEEFLDKNEISYKKMEASENDTFISIEFNVGIDTIDDFESFKEKINNKFHEFKYELSRIDNVVQIKFFKFISKLSNQVSKYLSTKVKNNFDFNFCFNENNEPLMLNCEKNSLIGISTNNETRTLSYLNALLAHLSINYNREFLQIVLLSPEQIESKILSTQNTLKKNIDSINGIKKFIETLKQDMQVIDKELKDKDNNLFKQFDKVKKLDYKYKFIIINHIEVIYKKHSELFNDLKKIINQASKYGLNFLFIDYAEDVKIFSQLDFSIILSDNESSKKQKNNSISKIYVPKNKQKFEVIVPRVNQEELSVISDKLASIFIKFNE